LRRRWTVETESLTLILVLVPSEIGHVVVLWECAILVVKLCALVGGHLPNRRGQKLLRFYLRCDKQP